MSMFERGTHFQFNWLLPIEADSFALACLLNERGPHLFILPSCKMLFDEIVVRSANECTQQIIKCLPVCCATAVFKMKEFREAFSLSLFPSVKYKQIRYLTPLLQKKKKKSSRTTHVIDMISKRLKTPFTAFLQLIQNICLECMSFSRSRAVSLCSL